MTGTAKMKGMHGEYEVRDLLQIQINEVYGEWNKTVVAGCPVKVPPNLKRNLEQTRGVGYDLEGLPWLALEVKRQEKADPNNVQEWWEQAKKSALGMREGKEVFVREPVLIHRRNWCPWSVRMFGYLVVRDVPGGARIKTYVDINIEAFLAYFRCKVLMDLTESD